MPKSRVTRISISLPPDLLENFDTTSKRTGYDERSRALQMAMRNFISDWEWTKGREGSGSGVLLMIYDHSVRGLEHTLTGIQHDHRDIVTSTLHVHLDEENCLLAIIVKGETARIKNLAQQFTKQRGVKQFKVSFFKGE